MNTQPATNAAGSAKVRTVKNVDWSYPTSTNAARFGFAGVGCWTVNLTEFGHKDWRGRDCAITKAQSGHATQGDAYDAAKVLPYAWASWARMASESVEAMRAGDASTPYTV